MSELELGLQQEGLLDLALQRCHETGLTLTEVLRSALQSPTGEAQRTSHAISEKHTRTMEEIIDGYRREIRENPEAALQRFWEESADVPVDFTSEEARYFARG